MSQEKTNVIDTIRNTILGDHNNVSCEICGYNHSQSKVEVTTEDGIADLYACESCYSLMINSAKFSNDIRINDITLL